MNRLERLSGGEIHEVWKVESDRGLGVLKQSRTPLAGVFAAEVDGLERLRATGALRVPEVWGVGDDWLLLEWLSTHEPTDEDALAERLADGLARLHRVRGTTFGLEIPNWNGRLPQTNDPTPGWVDFYRDSRLKPQIFLAAEAGLLPPEREARLDRVLDALDDLLAGCDEPPVLLHGDIWSGNVLCLDGDIPALIDPAVYYGIREMEIAYIELFGGIFDRLVPAYRERFPLSPGYEARRPLHQLYPLLNHLNHFGERYGPAVDLACHQLLAD